MKILVDLCMKAWLQSEGVAFLKIVFGIITSFNLIKYNFIINSLTIFL